MAKDVALSIVVPAYNEEKNITVCTTSLARALSTTSINYEILLVDNGSTDKTAHKIDLLAVHNRRIRKISIKKNIGYGYGVRRGIDVAKGEYVGWIDADNQVDVRFVIDVFYKIKNSGVDLVAAKRITRNDGLARRIASLFYNSLVALFFFTRVDDTNAKPKIFRKKAYMKAEIMSNDWFIDTELLLKFKARNYSVARVECASKERAHGTSNVKISTVLEFVKNLVLFRLGLR